MDLSVVQGAVRALKARGDHVSVRAVHSVTGGSFRDVSRLLREAKEFLDEDEVAALEVEVAERPPAPPIGKIAEIAASLKDLEGDIGRASTKLYHTQDLLQRLREQRPLPAVNPQDGVCSGYG